MKPKIKVRLRRIVRGNFRKSERTLFEELPAHVRRGLSNTDAVCFVSSGGNQLVFVYGFTNVGLTKNTGTVRRRFGIVTSIRLRLTGSTWSPEMLQNYAADCGIELEGIKRFEAHYKLMRSKKHGPGGSLVRRNRAAAKRRA